MMTVTIQIAHTVKYIPNKRIYSSQQSSTGPCGNAHISDDLQGTAMFQNPPTHSGFQHIITLSVENKYYDAM